MLYRIARSAIFQLDAEKAHDLAIQNFSRFTGTPLDLFYRQHVPERPVEVMGLTFKNPVGLAAGLDKNGECIDAFGAMGFGFVEVGTVTPRPQSGNDKPRLFRLIPAEGIINRFGFNNLGVDNLVENVKKSTYDGVIGINIGKNKDTPIEKGAEDYLICMEKVYQYAGYIAVNISSPNTPGLRSLQYGEALDDLLAQLKQKQIELADIHGKYVPLALKIAPDLDDQEIIQVCESLIRNKIDGVIGTNTTLDRTLVEGMDHCDEMGGLSGRPLQNKSTDVIRKMAIALDGALPIIGVGGIDSAMAAREKMQAGAQLVQVYTGFIYHGPRLVKDIVNGL
ncbi:quinone-dependent dihydroorotate dehydrogenase [Photobacterium phosphoreum]|jgi:dihydroorotate dehydrogenase|uniref:Dihydroorotate dehydrogenase (quinone) n=1 Tax=Photobacterium phosphoreum TaxID=659 RepID=A0AAW4ZX89_PHOPO|nr:quinone-dependent dihydroorotate dehydrogenase [Photobacterium phosphoreum]KJF86938.1 dihydroorotate dehydrogenase [Photobacterium phosphoreum]MCD9464939.1 quinone-dependent dihydroorotate dehydrogenase [Photobacterium phosphoreum]MCD9470994.1 quinone-dependent dihydroorotate dehydrogenase [Photobacterium phosphoreum]MCD9476499.1 quinone-dependent dihydroorotate dehydrogenase [Photobacterium phosphoreum]MCD9483108.1 quinone-dependent dihydroorotate dehydrogenase [Photobacterium phosphoreum]